MSAIELRSVRKEFGGTVALEEVSFTAPAAEFLVLLGPSGCGKSTTLRLIAGLEQVSGGQVLIGDQDVTRLPPAGRELSMVFQSYALFPHLNVAENIVFGLKVRKVPPAQRGQRLARVAELVGLADLLTRKPSQLSGGQRQRVALARAIIAEHSICLMDEPLSNLDAKLRHEMRVEIRALQRALGMTVVYVTHDQTEAMSMADKVLLMRAGRVEQEGAPDTLYARPDTTFTASFIGSPPMNIIDFGAGGLPAHNDGQAPLPAAGPCLYGIRAEDIRLADAGLPARLMAADYLGADSIVMYYNKDAFRDAGLDPEKPPATWDELVAMGKQLVKNKDGSDNVDRWGAMIPSTGYPYWMFGALAMQNGETLMNGSGNETFFAKPAVIEALQYWQALGSEHGVMPSGTIEWGTLRQNFLEQKTAIMWHSTGNLTVVKKSASFDFGVAMLPANKRRGTPTGGGNFYIFKKTTPEERRAALTFIKWMTQPERAAAWSIATGYIGTGPGAYKTPKLEAYVAEFPPAAVARDQLEFATAELSTYQTGRVRKLLDDAIQATLTGSKSASEALSSAQAQAERLLKRYR